MIMNLLPLLPLQPEGRPLVIAGPCSAESPMQMLETARGLAGRGTDVFRAGIWKPRTRPGGFEGMGDKALAWLAAVKDETGLLTATEVGNARHAELAMKAGVDILWIGARTSASPFAVQEIAEVLAGEDVPVLVKNPVCADLQLWIGAIERLYLRGLRRLGAIHRGFKTFGDTTYRNTPHWEIAAALRAELPSLPIICDPSHIGGKRSLVAPLSQQAMSMGYDGLIIESHCNPDAALSDAAQQITPTTLTALLDQLRQGRSHVAPTCSHQSSWRG